MEHFGRALEKFSPPWEIHGDPEPTGLPGITSLARKGAGAVHWQAGASKVCGVGVQKPRSAGVCWPAAQPLRGPCEGYSKRPSLGGGVAGTKVLGVWVLHTAEAGGRRGRAPGWPCPGGGSPGPHFCGPLIRCMHRPRWAPATRWRCSSRGSRDKKKWILGIRVLNFGSWCT